MTPSASPGSAPSAQAREVATRASAHEAAPQIPADEPLEVVLAGDRLVISIGVNVLAFAVGAGTQDFTITDAALAAREILRELQREEEDGTTPVHKLLDQAAFDAWENGGEGFLEADDE